MTSAPPSAVPSNAAVESLLASVHDRWLDQVRAFVEPATIATAGFWDRWSATRYLDDQFLDHFRLERSFLASIAHLINAGSAASLAWQAAYIERICARINDVGRQRGTGATVAAAAGDLVRDLSIWCAEMELAVAELWRSMLSPQTNAILDHLIVSAGLAAR
ncbi:MAG: hypothetical protein ACREL3_11130 [Gemmatimonadales bacterium]